MAHQPPIRARGRRPVTGPPTGPWHPDHPRCVSCGTTVIPHIQDGACRICYRAARGLGDEGHAVVPTRRPGDPPEGGPRAAR